MNMYEWAVWYVNAKQWSIIPLVFEAKRAAFAWKTFQQRRPTDEELKRWFQGRRQRNIGVVCGEVSGNLLVLDFDRPELFDFWYNYYDVPRSAMVLTGKGAHVYVRLDGEPVNNGKFYVQGQHAGELRYNGGYVVAPPSIHPSGAPYAWMDDSPIATLTFNDLHITTDAPSQCLAYRKPVRPRTPRATRSEGIPGHVRDPKAYVNAALAEELGKIAGAIPGQRNETLFTASLKLRKYDGVLDDVNLYDRLYEAGCAAGLPSPEVEHTINSAWSYQPQ
jgi:hypothetical protein